MRLYLPLISSEINEPVPARPAFAALPAQGVRGEALEVLEDDAQTEAALVSLTLLRDRPACAHRRIVLAVDYSGPIPSGVGVIETEAIDPTRLQPVALLVDGPEAESLVRAVIEAEDQDSADDAVAALWDEALEWYDIAEAPALAAALSADVDG